MTLAHRIAKGPAFEAIPPHIRAFPANQWHGRLAPSARVVSPAPALRRGCGSPEQRPALMTHSPDELSQRRQRASSSRHALPVVPYRDDLTGALDRRAGRERLTMEVERAQRLRSRLSVVV